MAASPESIRLRRAKVDEVYVTLKNMITSGKFISGDPLPTTRRLCADFNTYAEVICDARKRLREEGLVVVVNGGPQTELGTWVL